MRLSVSCFGVTAAIAVCSVFGAAPKGKAQEDETPAKKEVRRMVFEQQKIEGKIRRPQLVLIQADQRPKFESMIISGFGADANLLDFVDESVIENSPYQGAFQFQGTKVSNYVP